MQSSASNRVRGSSADTAMRSGLAPAAAHDLDLEGQIASLVRGSLSLNGFRQWFANAMWDIELAGDEDTMRFAYLVENRLAEFTGGFISAQGLIEVLREDLDVPSQSLMTRSR
ncbi:MAG: hypothetical protein H0V24_00800 [Chloroflexia bacterium]|nr:hypothetical protein [Chloroflexia bacterium]